MTKALHLLKLSASVTRAEADLAAEPGNRGRVIALHDARENLAFLLARAPQPGDDGEPPGYRPPLPAFLRRVQAEVARTLAAKAELARGMPADTTPWTPIVEPIRTVAPRPAPGRVGPRLAARLPAKTTQGSLL